MSWLEAIEAQEQNECHHIILCNCPVSVHSQFAWGAVKKAIGKAAAMSESCQHSTKTMFVQHNSKQVVHLSTRCRQDSVH